MYPYQINAMKCLYDATESMDSAGMELIEEHAPIILKCVVLGQGVNRAIRAFAKDAAELNSRLAYFDPEVHASNARSIKEALRLVA